MLINFQQPGNNSGKTKLEIREVTLGHEKRLTTAGYARLAPERLRSVFEATHPDNRQ